MPNKTKGKTKAKTKAKNRTFKRKIKRGKGFGKRIVSGLSKLAPFLLPEVGANKAINSINATSNRSSRSLLNETKGYIFGNNRNNKYRKTQLHKRTGYLPGRFAVIRKGKKITSRNGKQRIISNKIEFLKNNNPRYYNEKQYPSVKY